MELATAGLSEQDKSRSTEKPFSGSEKLVGTGVTGISCEDMVAFLSTCSGEAASMLALCSYGGGQRDFTCPSVKPAGVKLAYQNLLTNLSWQSKFTQSLCSASCCHKAFDLLHGALQPDLLCR